MSAAQKALAAGANVNGVNACSFLAHEIAISKGHAKMLQFLFQNGMALGLSGPARVRAATLVEYALNEKRPGLIKILKEAGADVDQVGINGKPLLVTAITEKQNDKVKALIDANANVNISIGESTPIEAAIMVKNSTALKLLFAAKVNINAESAFVHPPMVKSIEYDNHEAFQMLLKAKATVDASNAGPLLTAAVCAKSDKYYKTLMKNNLDINSPDGQSRTPLMAAASCRNLAMVKTLLSAGANVNAKNSQGMTVLDLQENMLKFLKNKPDEHKAVEEIISVLKAAGAK